MFVKDTVSGQTTRVSRSSTGIQGNDLSIRPAISATGRYVVFQSRASNLVAGDEHDSSEGEGSIPPGSAVQAAQ
ncbi:MAG: hypothetical protein HGA82_01075 [Anaerolineales bacterium]|nr:hypothetical protein [Anaerolineales bacterium]